MTFTVLHIDTMPDGIDVVVELENGQVRRFHWSSEQENIEAAIEEAIKLVEEGE